MSATAGGAIFNKNEDSWQNRVQFYTRVSTQTFLETATQIRDVSLKKSLPNGLKKGTSKAIEITITAAGVVTGGAFGCIEGSKAGKLFGKGVTKVIDACIKVNKNKKILNFLPHIRLL